MKLPSAEELYQMYLSGMSFQEIADKIGAKRGGVQSKITRAGYKSRNREEAIKNAYKNGRHRVVITQGPDHWAWKGGKERREYRNQVQKEICLNCGSRQNLGIHHKDFDHYNNAPENLEVLCVSCHMSLHKKLHWEAVKNGQEPKKSNGPVGWERTG